LNKHAASIVENSAQVLLILAQADFSVQTRIVQKGQNLRE